MANGDPMVLVALTGTDADNDGGDSLLLNGTLEVWADTAAAADYWEWDETQVSTLSREAGTRTDGSGSYYQSIAIAGPAQSLIGEYQQSVNLNGNASLPAMGYDNVWVKMRVWARNTAAGTATISLKHSQWDETGTLRVTTTQTPVALTSSWVMYTQSVKITYDLMHHHEMEIILTSTVAGDLVIDLDDAALYYYSTFAANPSMPDNQIMSIPMRQFRRTLGGRLIRSRPAGPVAKIEKQLSFRLIGQAQYDEFLGLWMYDGPLLWTPNHPHLPSTLQVRWVNDFDFHSIGPFSSGPLYAGTMVLSEI